MKKIRKINFVNHPILGNLELDFCDKNGNAVDTVIFAGENGTGKSTIIDAIYKLIARYPAITNSLDFEVNIEYEIDKKNINFKYKNKKNNENILFFVNVENDKEYFVLNEEFIVKYQMIGIYSDVDINFHSSNQLTSVTSLSLDTETKSQRSSTDLPTKINQLLIDIQALDDADLAFDARKNPEKRIGELAVPQRMPRFTQAFNLMFNNLFYSRIENKDNHKVIIFSKNGKDIPIESLSSGEKQIVYRGCFLLKDVNALNEAFVFIDEPEISLHPIWQEKILDYYKGIFTNEQGNQTSQLFVVTHSPFIIHNNNRRNDKVIVLLRDENGQIIVSDKPEYYKCDSIEVVQDAFSIQNFSLDKPVVYLEGRTDEKYFNKALEVYGLSVPFQFKWIGSIDEKGEEINTGKEALNKAVVFLRSKNNPIKSVCLYDCDANKKMEDINNVITLSISKNDKNDRNIIAGIENALVFGDIDIEPFRKQKKSMNEYGIEKAIPDFHKMECCEYICSLNNEQLQNVFINLKSVIEEIIRLLAK